jgi:hypothetical protein
VFVTVAVTVCIHVEVLHLGTLLLASPYKPLIIWRFSYGVAVFVAHFEVVVQVLVVVLQMVFLTVVVLFQKVSQNSKPGEEG